MGLESSVGTWWWLPGVMLVVDAGFSGGLTSNGGGTGEGWASRLRGSRWSEVKLVDGVWHVELRTCGERK
jgi:hypothetical protein